LTFLLKTGNAVQKYLMTFIPIITILLALFIPGSVARNPESDLKPGWECPFDVSFNMKEFREKQIAFQGGGAGADWGSFLV